MSSNARYEKRNRKMRAKHKKETGKTLGKRQTSGKGSMKKKNGEPSNYAMALKKWGFGSREAASKFCNNNKAKK